MGGYESLSICYEFGMRSRRVVCLGRGRMRRAGGGVGGTVSGMGSLLRLGMGVSYSVSMNVGCTRMRWV